MKIKLFVLSCFLTVAFFLTGCDVAGDTAAEALTPPDMGTPTELVATNATAPGTESDALLLLTETLDLLSTEMSANTVPAGYSVIAPGARGIVMETNTQTQDISWQGTVASGGTVDVDGSITTTITMPSETSTGFTPNTTYTDFIKMLMNVDISGTLTGVTLTNETYTYTISGRMQDTVNINMNMDVRTGTDMVEGTDTTYNLDLAVSDLYGLAYSVKRVNSVGNTSVGAKFIISYYIDLAENDIDTASDDFAPGILSALQQETVNIKVYDDSNNLVYDINRPVSDINDSFLSMM